VFGDGSGVFAHPTGLRGLYGLFKAFRWVACVVIGQCYWVWPERLEFMVPVGLMSSGAYVSGLALGPIGHSFDQRRGARSPSFGDVVGWLLWPFRLFPFFSGSRTKVRSRDQLVPRWLLSLILRNRSVTNASAKIRTGPFGTFGHSFAGKGVGRILSVTLQSRWFVRMSTDRL